MKKTFRKCPKCEGRAKAVYDCCTPVHEDTCHRSKGKGTILAVKWRRRITQQTKRGSQYDKLTLHVVEELMPCPKCGVEPSGSCGYGYWSPDTSNGSAEFDCLYPWDNDPGGCGYCPFLWCEGCKKKFNDEFVSKTKTDGTRRKEEKRGLL